MTAKRKVSTGKKLKLKKETLKDLGAKNARRIKGGALPTRLCRSAFVACACTKVGFP